MKETPRAMQYTDASAEGKPLQHENYDSTKQADSMFVRGAAGEWQASDAAQFTEADTEGKPLQQEKYFTVRLAFIRVAATEWKALAALTVEEQKFWSAAPATRANTKPSKWSE